MSHRDDERSLRLVPSEARRVQVGAVFALALLTPSLVDRAPPWTQATPVVFSLAPLEASPSVARTDASADPVRSLWLGIRFDLQSASAETLQIVPGIGPRLAARIVEDRERNGPFRSVEEVERVKGVGPKLRARLALYAHVGPPSEAPPE